MITQKPRLRHEKRKRKTETKTQTKEPKNQRHLPPGKTENARHAPNELVNI